MKLFVLFGLVLLGMSSVEHLLAQTPQIVTPNGGEKLKAGSSYTIRWLGIRTGDTSTLEYSTNSGTSWLPIADKLTSVSHPWNPIPATPSNQCRVRLSVTRPLAAADTVLSCMPTDATKFASSRNAEFDPSGAWVVTADDSGYVRVYNSTTTALRWENRICTPVLPTNFVRIINARFSPDGLLIAAYTARDSIIILNATTGAEIQRWYNGYQARTPDNDRSCAFSPDGSMIAVSTQQIGFPQNGIVRLYNPTSGSLIREMTQFTDGGVNILQWTADSKRFLAGMASGRIFVVDATSGATVQTISTVGTVESASFSPDGLSIVSTARSRNQIQMWNVASGTLKFQLSFTRDSSAWMYVVFAKDGASFYTANESLTAPTVYMIRQRSATDGSLINNVRYARVGLGSFNYNASETRFCCTSSFGGVVLQAPVGGVQTFTDISDGDFSIEANAPQLDSALIYIPTLRANAGETIDVPIKIRGALALKATSLQVNLRCLADILEPVTPPLGTNIVGKERIMPLTLPAQADADSILLRIPCRAMLSIDSTSVLDLDSVIVTGTAKVTVQDGSITLEICREGSPRLFDDSHTLLLRLQSAHPLDKSLLETEVSLIENGFTSLVLSDTDGRALSLLPPAWMNAGKHHLSLPIEHVAAGRYMLQLITPTQVLVLPIIVVR